MPITFIPSDEILTALSGPNEAPGFSRAVEKGLVNAFLLIWPENA